MTIDLSNPILLSDSYKLSHFQQYPPGTTEIYSYFESRTGAKWNQTLFFGLQYILKKYFTGQVVTRDRISQAREFARLHMSDGSFNEEGWRYILDKYNGYLPVEIKAVPEGTLVPESNVLMTIRNTDPKCFWLTNYMETVLCQLWYPCTIATRSWHHRDYLQKAAIKSGDPSLVPFKLHDFGFRGASTVESAGIGGLAHLISFKGTDTTRAILTGMEYYQSGMCGFSIPATEHSTITSWGKEGELDAYRNLLQQYPNGLVACVSDSFDIYKACADMWGGALRNEVLARNGTLVIRPDSGDIFETVLKTTQILEDKFGVTENERGYKVLNDRVRLIQGDGMNDDSLPALVDHLLANKYSIDNFAFGMGGGLLQKLDRDTQRFAFKCSLAVVNGEERPVFKQPKTDPTKNSKWGRLKLINTNGKYRTVRIGSDQDLPEEPDVLRTVFKNGDLLVNDTFDTIVRRAGW